MRSNAARFFLEMQLSKLLQKKWFRNIFNGNKESEFYLLENEFRMSYLFIMLKKFSLWNKESYLTKEKNWENVINGLKSYIDSTILHYMITSTSTSVMVFYFLQRLIGPNSSVGRNLILATITNLADSKIINQLFFSTSFVIMPFLFLALLHFSIVLSRG